ncbi:MAG: DUF1467 family protein [Pseudomonadota bacterium]
MNIGAAIVVYVIVWWCVFFAVLPMGVESESERTGTDDAAEDAAPVAGADPGAPVNPDIKRKALLTTGVSAVLSVIIIAVIMSGVINFKD